MFDVDCVNNSCTFASVGSVEDLCERLHPSPPSDKCEQAESKLMTLELNVCRGRVIAGGPADSPCSGSTTVGQLMAQTDAALCSPGRTRDACVRADCMADDVNTGLALWTNSLRIQPTSGGAILIIWGAPYATPSTEAPARYRVWRRPTSTATLALMAEVSGNNPSYLDKQAQTDSDQYEVTAVW